MNEKISKFTKGQQDFFTEPGDPDSVTEKEEAAARSTKEERMITKEEARRRYAIIRTEIDKTKKMLAEKAKETKEEEKGRFPKLNLS
jgi:hypothetical protein